MTFTPPVVMPSAQESDFENFTGLSGLSAGDQARVTIMLDRARRRLQSVIMPPSGLSTDDTANWIDAVCELAWLYFEAEKQNAMKILAAPVQSLALGGTMTWTKAQPDKTLLPPLPSVVIVLNQWGIGLPNQKIVLEGDQDYADPNAWPAEVGAAEPLWFNWRGWQWGGPPTLIQGGYGGPNGQSFPDQGLV